ncbi:MAG TPA: CvpA family protein [Chitinophagaceae bacterium]|nr:CvpA family protein [Chitinophagaceae bacterium]
MIIDIAFVIVMVIAVFKGFSKGLIVGIFSVLAFIIGLAAAIKLSAVVASYLEKDVTSFNKWLPVISFLLVFIVVALLVGMGARLIKKTVDFAMLGWLDSLGGMVLYMVIYAVIFSILLFFAVKVSLIKAGAIADSHVYKYIAPWGPDVINYFGKIIPVFKDMFRELESFFGHLAQKNT